MRREILLRSRPLVKQVEINCDEVNIVFRILDIYKKPGSENQENRQYHCGSSTQMLGRTARQNEHGSYSIITIKPANYEKSYP